MFSLDGICLFLKLFPLDFFFQYWANAIFRKLSQHLPYSLVIEKLSKHFDRHFDVSKVSQRGIADNSRYSLGGRYCVRIRA